MLTQRSMQQWRSMAVSLYRRLLLFGLGAAALVNLVGWFLLPPQSRPVSVHESRSLTGLVSTEGPSLSIRYGFYMALDDATEGGTLIVPPDAPLADELVDGFADMELLTVGYDVAAPALDEVVVGQGMLRFDGEEVAYAIVAGDDDVWWWAMDDGTVVIIPDSVAPAPEVEP